MSLSDYLTDQPWKTRAACRGMDQAIFFPNQGGTTIERARQICAGCEVSTECLEYALSYTIHYEYGIWGGTTVRQRRRMRKERAA